MFCPLQTFVYKSASITLSIFRTSLPHRKQR